MEFCRMYMVIKNEVNVMLFRPSAPRILDQDSRLDKHVGAFDTDSAKCDSHFNNKHSTPPPPHPFPRSMLCVAMC
jgi:hypothetical protein